MDRKSQKFNERYRLTPRAFTLIETLVVIAVIGILATVIIVSLGSARGRARDTKRKTEISQVGQVLTLGCIEPEGGETEIDFKVMTEQLKEKYPQYEKYIKYLPRDPLRGTEEETKYYYLYNPETKKCAAYANLENEKEKVTLPHLSRPTAGGGTGVLEGDLGWSGSHKYFQVSN